MKAAASPTSLARRRKPSLAARVRPFWVLGALALIPIAWGSVWFVQSPSFRVTHIAIDTPRGSPVSREDVRRAAAVNAGSNVWLLDVASIARRIEALPYVASASLHRGQLPKPFVEIGITLRRPSGCVRAAGRTVTIDASSRILQAGCVLPSGVLLDVPHASLPPPGGTIADPDVARLLADTKLLAASDLALQRAGFDRYGGLEVLDASGVTLRFGTDDDLVQKAALLSPVRAGIGSKRAIRAIDLRAPQTPTVEFR